MDNARWRLCFLDNFSPEFCIFSQAGEHFCEFRNSLKGGAAEGVCGPGAAALLMVCMDNFTGYLTMICSLSVFVLIFPISLQHW